MQGEMGTAAPLGTGSVPRAGKQKPKRRIQLRPLQSIYSSTSVLRECTQGVVSILCWFAARDRYSSFDIREWIFPKIIPGKEMFWHKATGFLGWMRRFSWLVHAQMVIESSCLLHDFPFFCSLKGLLRVTTRGVGRANRCCADTGLIGHSGIKNKIFSPRLGPFIVSKVGADRCSGTSFIGHWKKLALLWFQWNAGEKLTGNKRAFLTPLLTKAH